MSVVRAPFRGTGPGMVVLFRTKGFKRENLRFNHHMELGDTWFVVDGCVMRTWDDTEWATCIVDCAETRGGEVDAMDTSSD